MFRITGGGKTKAKMEDRPVLGDLLEFKCSGKAEERRRITW
jgi:hypothetical protein